MVRAPGLMSREATGSSPVARLNRERPMIHFTDVACENALLESGNFFPIANLNDKDNAGVWSELAGTSVGDDALLESMRMALSGKYVFPINATALKKLAAKLKLQAIIDKIDDTEKQFLPWRLNDLREALKAAGAIE